MSHLYLAMGVLRAFEENGGEEEERIHAEWALQYCFHQTEKALLELCHYFPSRYLGFKKRLCIFPAAQYVVTASDKASHRHCTFDDYKYSLSRYAQKIYLSFQYKRRTG